MGCSCSKGVKPASVQPRKNVVKPTGRVIHKSSNGSKAIRRVLERY